MDRSNIKISIIFVCFLCMFALCIFGNEGPEKQFEHAYRLYQHGSYQDAYQAYEGIDNKTPAIWCNMGNCLYHLQKYDDAYICWKRALKHVYFKQWFGIQYNLDLLVQMDIQKSKILSFLNFFKRFYLPFPLGILQVLFLLMWGIFLACMFKHTRYFLRIFFLFIIILLGVGIGLHYNEQFYKYALVSESEVPVYTGPNKDFHILTHIKMHDCVCICQQKENWCKIKSGACNGWVESQVLKIIN